MSAPGPTDTGQTRARVMVITMIALCTGVELVLQMGDLNLLGIPRLRAAAYEYAGFWAQLLHGWQPNYPGQSFAMFVTYALLHGGLLHLVFNMMALWSLGLAVSEEAGAGGLATVMAAGIVGGAVAHGLMTTSLQPMVGASGGLFGLAGALVGWAVADRRELVGGLRPAAQAVALLIAINLAMYWALDGQLAWQAHLGGVIAGALAGWSLERRPPPAEDDDKDDAPL